MLQLHKHEEVPMPRAYSTDLRERVIAACEAGVLTRAEIAEQFQVSEGAVYSWLRRWKATHSVAPAAHSGGRESQVNPEVLCALVEEQNDRTLPEYVELYAERTGRRYSSSYLSRMFARHQISRKRRRYAPRNSTSSRSL
jgi:transposase